MAGPSWTAHGVAAEESVATFEWRHRLVRHHPSTGAGMACVEPGLRASPRSRRGPDTGSSGRAADRRQRGDRRAFGPAGAAGQPCGAISLVTTMSTLPPGRTTVGQRRGWPARQYAAMIATKARELGV